MLTKALLLLAPALYAQSIEGVVTNSVTHEPIPGAVVLVTQATGKGVRTTTDYAGAFRLADLAPGEYWGSVFKEAFEAKPGFIRFRIDGTPLPPQRLAMAPYPSLNGRVIGLDGKADPSSSVDLVRIGDGGSAPPSSEVDAEGRFRFDHIQPGVFAILADPRLEGQVPRTYFPSATDLPAATRIAVQAGPDLSGFEIVLRRVPAFRVSGRALDPDGAPAAGARVEIDSFEHAATTGADGAFVVTGIRPGSRRIAIDYLGRFRGLAHLEVTDRDLENVVLRAVRPAPVVAAVELDGRPAVYRGRASLVSRTVSSSDAFIDIAGLHFRDVSPGRYRLSLLPAVNGVYMEGVYLDAVMLGDVDIGLQEFDLPVDGPPLRVVLKSGGGTVRGMAVGFPPMSAAYLVPREERLRALPSVRFEMGVVGPFAFDHVRPGDYYVVVLDAIRTIPYWEAAPRTRIEASPIVHVENGAVVSVEVRP